MITINSQSSISLLAGRRQTLVFMEFESFYVKINLSLSLAFNQQMNRQID